MQGIAPGELAAGDAAQVTLEDVLAAVQEGDIDFRSLATNARHVLDHTSQVSIGGLLAQYPAAQGLGTIVGYLALAVKHGIVVRDQTEQVGWSTGELTCRAAIPLAYFIADRKEELHG